VKILAAIEGALVALALSSVLWVLVIQSVGLLRSMPRERFLPIQMQLVRVWSVALAAITALVAVAALLRSGLSAWPALGASAAAVLCARWAIPRALRMGGAALRSEESAPMSAGGFIADGGGAATRVWHRVVLACTAAVVAGLAMDAHALSGSGDHAHEIMPVAPHAGYARARARIDSVTVENIHRLEREAATTLSNGGSGDVRPLREGWNRIFAQCTTRGPDHDRLHGFLVPLAAVLQRAESSEGAARQSAVRALVCELGRFDAGFEAAR
jgi:hypothetical protein